MLAGSRSAQCSTRIRATQTGRRVAFVILCLLLTPACLGSGSESSDGSTARPGLTGGMSVASPAAASPAPGGRPATVASPTAIANGAYLTINELPALGVLVTDPGLGAEYAFTADSLYRQEDGKTWVRVGDFGEDLALVGDPLHHDTLYRGGHAPCALAGPPVPLSISRDGGLTWQVLDAGHDVRPLIVRAEDPNVIFGDRCGLAISTDRGASWRDLGIEPGFTLSDLSLAGDQLYGVYTSEGGTSRLSSINVGHLDMPLVGRVLLEFWGRGVVLASRDLLLVGESRGVQISRDGGRTWTLSRQGMEPVTIAVDVLAESNLASELSGEFGVLSLAVQPKREKRIFAGTARGLYLSEDGGQTWGPLPEIEEIPVQALDFGFDGNQLYVTTSEGVAVLRNP